MLRATDSGRLTDEAKASSSAAPRTITDRNGDAGPSHTPYSEDRSTGSRASEDGVRIKDLDSGKEYNLRKVGLCSCGLVIAMPLHTFWFI